MELNLKEEFKSCVPEKIVVYLNKQKVDTLFKAAVIVDEFVLTHRAVLHTVNTSQVLFQKCIGSRQILTAVNVFTAT